MGDLSVEIESVLFAALLDDIDRGWLQRCPRFLQFWGEGQARVAFPTATELASTSIDIDQLVDQCFLCKTTTAARWLWLQCTAGSPLSGKHSLGLTQNIRTAQANRDRAEPRRDPQKRSSGYGCKVRTMLATAQKAGNLAPGGLGTVTRPPIRVAPSLQ